MEDPAERPAKMAKLGGSFKSYGQEKPTVTLSTSTTTTASSNEILQRQQELSRQQPVDNFPFPTLSDNVIKPTFVKEGRKMRGSLQGSPDTSERGEDEEEEKGEDSVDGSTPSTPLNSSTPLTFRARSDSSNLATAGKTTLFCLQ